MSSFITLRTILPRIPNSSFVKPIDWQINRGEVWSVIGPNGSGKSILSQVLCGRYYIEEGQIEYNFLDEFETARREKELLNLNRHIRIVSFEAAYSMADYREMYYQQRFNNSELDSAPFVSDLFHPNDTDSETIRQVYDIFNIKKLMDRRLIQLSSGELRKLVISKILLENPRMLIFDNPFIGLDAASHKSLEKIFIQLNNCGFQLLFLVPSADEIPVCTTHILEMNNCEVISKIETKLFNMFQPTKEMFFQSVIDWKYIPPVCNDEYNEVVKMRDIEISYGEQIICKGINWSIKRGEKWALLGPNGSGKSTLLSYIFADNPQAYSKNLSLFDCRRGSGESIWDIKKRIGFTSSEMHLYYRQQANCLAIVESGFFDSIGLFRTCTEEQSRIARYLMEQLSIIHIAERSFMRISSGEQRLVLFARSLVKNPELLILDEPFHGLDVVNRKKCIQIVEAYCLQPGKTLIFVTHNREEIPKCVDRVMELG